MSGVAACCSVLQYVAVCCSVLQCFALRCVAVFCSALQRNTAFFTVLRCVAVVTSDRFVVHMEIQSLFFCIYFPCCLIILEIFNILQGQLHTIGSTELQTQGLISKETQKLTSLLTCCTHIAGAAILVAQNYTKVTQ